MVLLEIDNTTYEAIELWSELSLNKARELFKLANTAPEELLYILKEQSKGEEADKDQIALRVNILEDKESELDSFFKKIFLHLTNVPVEVLKSVAIEDIRTIYTNYLVNFVFGVLHFPLEQDEALDSFNYAGSNYYAPESKKIMGTLRYFYNEDTSVFCDASDLDFNGRKSDVGKYQFAEQIVAIVYRERGDKYDENEAIETADKMFNGDLTCDIFHSALKQLSLANTTLKLLFPNLYESYGDMYSKQASDSSGLSDFGWFTSIFTIAKMGILNQEGLTPLASVQRTNLYDFMTVLSNHRADNDFKKIYKENINKK